MSDPTITITTAPPLPELPIEAAPAPKRKRKRKGLVIGGIVGAVVLVAIISAVANGGGSDEPAAAVKPAAAAVDEPAEAAVEPVLVTVPANLIGMPLADAVVVLDALGLVAVDDGDGLEGAKVLAVAESGAVEQGSTVTLTVDKKPVYTLAQENALEAAQNYVDLMPFSRQGLIDQLSSEYGSGFDVETATWAADATGADWNAEAAEAAQSYLDTMAFSRDGLYEQLTSAYGGQFTPEQANAGLSAVGY